MKKVTDDKKSIVVDILCDAFDSNISVNYIVKQDRNRKARIRHLMEYSFDLCNLHGNVFLSDDEKGCALTLLPHLKKISLKTILLDLKLLFYSIGITRLFKISDRGKSKVITLITAFVTFGLLASRMQISIIK